MIKIINASKFSSWGNKTLQRDTGLLLLRRSLLAFLIVALLLCSLPVTPKAIAGDAEGYIHA